MERELGSRVAVFFDAENLIIEAQKAGLPINVKLVMDRVRESGTLSFARAYADWTMSHTITYISGFQENVIELTQLSSAYGKNTGDIQIVVDALEMALSSNSPDLFVIVGGDRDYVPLVQRLKRYGKVVIGIGLHDSTSQALTRVCNSFIYYENLLPDAGLDNSQDIEGSDATTETQFLPTPISNNIDEEERDAFELLLRAVVALERDIKEPLGTRTNLLMQQLDPTFDLSRFRFSKFKEFVEAAVEAGYVKFAGKHGLDFKLESAKKSDRSSLPQPVSFLKRTFETTGEILQAYRSVLEEKRIPLVPWNERYLLVKHLWEELERSEEGLTISQMTEFMLDGAGKYVFRVPRAAVQKIAYSLNIGKALLVNNEQRMMGPQELFTQRAKAWCSLDEALLRVNYSYVWGIHDAYPQLSMQQRALALLLFDQDGGDQLEMVDKILERLGVYKG